MFILVPIEGVDDSMNISTGKTVAVIPLDLLSIAKIEEDKETGYAIVYYKGAPSVKTLVKFTAFLSIFVKQGICYFDFSKECSAISSNVAEFIKLNDR